MKSTTLKNTMLGTAIAFAMGLTVTPLQASEGQAADQATPPIVTDDPAHTTRADISSTRTDVTSGVTERPSRSYTNHDPVDAEDFVETASAKDIAEINTARLALEEGSPAVQAYANKIIADHSANSAELKAVATRANLDIADDATLMDRAKALVLSVRSGDSFDEAFINNQIAAHEESIELFERAAMSDHPEISSFARNKLPALQEHLRMANALKSEISSL